jgi:hypothetical protein
MRNLDLVDAVIALHEIARTIEREIGRGQLSDDVRACADRLHHYSITDAKISRLTQNIIDKAKE